MCIRDSQRTEIERGQVLIKPGTVNCHKKFTCQVYVLTKDDGGRHTPVSYTHLDVYKRQDSEEEIRKNNSDAEGIRTI